MYLHLFLHIVSLSCQFPDEPIPPESGSSQKAKCPTFSSGQLIDRFARFPQLSVKLQKLFLCLRIFLRKAQKNGNLISDHLCDPSGVFLLLFACI